MHIPDVVVIPPAARSKHLFDDFTKKTMQSGLSNPSVDEGDSNCDDCKGRPYAKYFQNGKFFFGFVASYYWDDDKRKKFYNIEHDDGDKEDVLETINHYK